MPSSSHRGRRSKLGVRADVAFFTLFFLIGTVVFYFLTLEPLLGVLAARSWTLTPCTVISSRVQSHGGNDGTTYRVDILYTYEFNGRAYRSNRYHFMGGSTSGYKGKADIVHRHPTGSKVTCYVNPRNPGDTVLERGWTDEMWFGAIPVVFMLIGAGGVIGAMRKGRTRTGGDSAFEDASDEAGPEGGSSGEAGHD
jgi:hypothetical protein